MLNKDATRVGGAGSAAAQLSHLEDIIPNYNSEIKKGIPVRNFQSLTLLSTKCPPPGHLKRVFDVYDWST